MLFSWQGWMSHSVSPFVIFAIQLGISHLFYQRYLRHIVPTMASGSAVMALGIFGSESLPQLEANAFVILIYSYQLLIIWLYLAILLVSSYFDGRLSLSRLDDKVALGTWVAGTVVTAILLDQSRSSLDGVIALLSIIAILLYLIYLVIIAQQFFFYVRRRFHQQATGMILLSTVSTQSIVLLISIFFHVHVPVEFYQALILLGCLFYVLGLCEIIRYSFSTHKHHFIASFPNTNTINFGAMAITGYAMVNSQSFPVWVVVAVWWWSIATFCFVEGCEMIRLVIRMKIKGFVRGACVYCTSQWSRIFTFGMLYAFTLSYYNYEYPPNRLVIGIASYGQYVVAFLLLVELVLALQFNFNQES